MTFGTTLVQYGCVSKQGQETCSCLSDCDSSAVTRLTVRIKNGEHKLYAGSFLSTALFDDLCTETVNWFGTVRPSRKGMHKSFEQKIKLKWCDVQTRMKGNLTVVACALLLSLDGI